MEKKFKGKTSHLSIGKLGGSGKTSKITRYIPTREAALEIREAATALELKPPSQKNFARREAELATKLVDQIAEEDANVTELCVTYGLRREELGRLTGFSLRALAEWASGKLPSQPAMRRLREIRRLLDALADIVRRESIRNWLQRPNQAFDGLTPLQVIEIGEIDRLWAMVHDLASGQPE